MTVPATVAAKKPGPARPAGSDNNSWRGDISRVIPSEARISRSWRRSRSLASLGMTAAARFVAKTVVRLARPGGLTWHTGSLIIGYGRGDTRKGYERTPSQCCLKPARAGKCRAHETAASPVRSGKDTVMKLFQACSGRGWLFASRFGPCGARDRRWPPPLPPPSRPTARKSKRRSRRRSSSSSRTRRCGIARSGAGPVGLVMLENHSEPRHPGSPKPSKRSAA